MIDAPRHTAKQIADDVAAGMDPDVEGVPAQYYDAAIQRIAELEATVARVKAESLRVVSDGGPVTAFRLDGNDKFIQVEGEVYYRSGEALICTNTRIYQGLDDDTIVQPVRLERWEDVG